MWGGRLRSRLYGEAALQRLVMVRRYGPGYMAKPRYSDGGDTDSGIGAVSVRW